MSSSSIPSDNSSRFYAPNIEPGEKERFGDQICSNESAPGWLQTPGFYQLLGGLSFSSALASGGLALACQFKDSLPQQLKVIKAISNAHPQLKQLAAAAAIITGLASLTLFAYSKLSRFPINDLNERLALARRCAPEIEAGNFDELPEEEQNYLNTNQPEFIQNCINKKNKEIKDEILSILDPLKNSFSNNILTEEEKNAAVKTWREAAREIVGRNSWKNFVDSKEFDNYKESFKSGNNQKLKNLLINQLFTTEELLIEKLGDRNSYPEFALLGDSFLADWFSQVEKDQFNTLPENIQSYLINNHYNPKYVNESNQRLKLQLDQALEKFKNGTPEGATDAEKREALDEWRTSTLEVLKSAGWEQFKDSDGFNEYKDSLKNDLNTEQLMAQLVFANPNFINESIDDWKSRPEFFFLGDTFSSSFVTNSENYLRFNINLDDKNSPLYTVNNESIHCASKYLNKEGDLKNKINEILLDSLDNILLDRSKPNNEKLSYINHLIDITNSKTQKDKIVKSIEELQNTQLKLDEETLFELTKKFDAFNNLLDLLSLLTEEDNRSELNRRLSTILNKKIENQNTKTLFNIFSIKASDFYFGKWQHLELEISEDSKTKLKEAIKEAFNGEASASAGSSSSNPNEDQAEEALGEFNFSQACALMEFIPDNLKNVFKRPIEKELNTYLESSKDPHALLFSGESDYRLQLWRNLNLNLSNKNKDNLLENLDLSEVEQMHQLAPFFKAEYRYLGFNEDLIKEPHNIQFIFKLLKQKVAINKYGPKLGDLFFAYFKNNQNLFVERGNATPQANPLNSFIKTLVPFNFFIAIQEGQVPDFFNFVANHKDLSFSSKEVFLKKFMVSEKSQSVAKEALAKEALAKEALAKALEFESTQQIRDLNAEASRRSFFEALVRSKNDNELCCEVWAKHKPPLGEAFKRAFAEAMCNKYTEGVKKSQLDHDAASRLKHMHYLYESHTAKDSNSRNFQLNKDDLHPQDVNTFFESYLAEGSKENSQPEGKGKEKA